MPIASLTDLDTYGGAPPAVLAQRDQAFRTKQLAAAESFALGYVSASSAGPITNPPLSLVVAICKMAAYEIMSDIGVNPETGDSKYKIAADEQKAWLLDIGKGHAVITPFVDATPNTSEGAPEATSCTPRGW